jgi:hypothetical protein
MGTASEQGIDVFTTGLEWTQASNLGGELARPYV